MSNETSSTNKPPKANPFIEGKHRCWEVICWIDNPQHVDDMKVLLCDRRCVGILHDKDITDEGELKKPHYHIIIKFDNASTFGSVMKLIPNHDEGNVRFVKSEKGAYRYLIHKDNPEKTQYSYEDVVGNVALAKKYFRDDDIEGYQLIQILEFIQNYDNRLFDTVVLRWCVEEGFYSVYRRNCYTLSRIIDQFNKEQIYLKNRERYIDEL